MPFLVIMWKSADDFSIGKDQFPLSPLGILAHNLNQSCHYKTAARVDNGG